GNRLRENYLAEHFLLLRAHHFMALCLLALALHGCEAALALLTEIQCLRNGQAATTTRLLLLEADFRVLVAFSLLIDEFSLGLTVFRLFVIRLDLLLLGVVILFFGQRRGDGHGLGHGRRFLLDAGGLARLSAQTL